MATPYPEEVKAAVLVQLTVEEGNQSRVARNTGVPLSTVRRWRKEWDDNGIPPHLWELADKEATTFTDRAKAVRELALTKLEEALHAGEVKPAQLVAVIGMFTDKITVAEGFATQRTEHVAKLELPTAEETADFALSSMNALRKRLTEINELDQEVIPVVNALPPAKET